MPPRRLIIACLQPPQITIPLALTTARSAADEYDRHLFVISLSCAVYANLVGLLMCTGFAVLLTGSPKGSARAFAKKFHLLLVLPTLQLVMGILGLFVAVFVSIRVKYPSIFGPLLITSALTTTVFVGGMMLLYYLLHVRRILHSDTAFQAYQLAQHEEEATEAAVKRVLYDAAAAVGDSSDGSSVGDSGTDGADASGVPPKPLRLDSAVVLALASPSGRATTRPTRRERSHGPASMLHTARRSHRTVDGAAAGAVAVDPAGIGGLAGPE